MALNEFDVLDFASFGFCLAAVVAVLLLFYVLQPVVVYGIAASLYSFVTLKRGKLYVWNHEMSLAAADSPLVRRQPLLGCWKRFGAARTRAGQPEVCDGGADAYETFPCCCLPFACCPTTQGTIRYLLWTGVLLVMTLFWTQCVLQSVFWHGFGCPEPGIAAGASAAFDPTDSAQSTVEFGCYVLSDTFLAYHNSRLVNCTATAAGDANTGAGPDTYDADTWKVCFRWVPQSPENYLNALASAATVFTFVIGVLISAMGNALHAHAHAERIERALILAGAFVFWVIVPIILTRGLFDTPMGYVVVEAIGADLIVVAKLHRTWRREVLRADDQRKRQLVVAHKPEPQI